MSWFWRSHSSVNTSSNNANVKKSGIEELWHWAWQVVKWTADALFYTLAFLGEWGLWVGSMIHEKLWNKNPDVRDMRKKMRKHHFHQSWKSFGKAVDWLWNVTKWAFHTAKWTVRTVFKSGNDAVKTLREDKSKNKNKK